MILNNWKMTCGEYKDLECLAPCSMYSVLLEHKLIEDPFYGINEEKVTALSELDCIFETEIILEEETLEREYIELKLSGIDTICDIIVNGNIIDSVKNMHREYVYNVKNYVVKGKNIVRLEFSSPVEYFKKMNNKHWLYTNGDTIEGAAHLRKALYMSGWDWGPQLPDMGIWRPVVIEAYDGDKILDVYVKQNHKNNKVNLDIEVETGCQAVVESGQVEADVEHLRGLPLRIGITQVGKGVTL